MSTALDLFSETSTEVLESLDFPVPCDHSSHGSMPSHHEGPAAFVAKVTHDCPNRPGVLGQVYPCCAKWASVVINHLDKPWLCPICKQLSVGSEMCIIVGSLDQM